MVAATGSADRSGPVATVREGFIDADGGVQLYVRRVGDSSQTVIVLHGGPGFTMEYLAADIEPLAEKHTLVFYDQRGTGRSTLVSDAAGLDAQRFVDDLETVRQHFGLDRLNLLSHSWGAAVAALYAMRHPERIERMIFVGAMPLRHAELVRTFQAVEAGGDSEWRQQLHERRVAWRNDPGNAAACRAYYATWFIPFYGNKAAAGRSKGDFAAGGPDSLRNKIASVDRFTIASLGEWDWRTSLRAIHALALFFHGTADVISVDTAREWVAALPNARLLLLEDVGHFPYLETPEQFFPAVSRFLDGQWPKGARRK
jgi:proline iminopeptidase